MRSNPLPYAVRYACILTIMLTIGSPVPSVAQSSQFGSAVPVSITSVVRQNVPIILRGLGTVQAYYAVQVRSRVDGTLTEIPAREGQDVKKGDLLALIDPRPYQAILDSAAPVVSLVMSHRVV